MFDAFLVAKYADEMHFKPLIFAIEFRHEMRDPLGALSRQHALDCARMPGKLGSTQIDLDVAQQPTSAIAIQ